MSLLNIKRRGNIKRIEELHELGQRADSIQQVFKKHDIQVSLGFINCVVNGELEELDRDSLPKQVVKDLKAEKEKLMEGVAV